MKQYNFVHVELRMYSFEANMMPLYMQHILFRPVAFYAYELYF